MSDVHSTGALRQQPEAVDHDRAEKYRWCGQGPEPAKWWHAVGKIAIDADEWPTLREAIDRMVGECRPDQPKKPEEQDGP